MATSRIEGDLIVTGALVAQGGFTPANGSIDDDAVASGTNIDADKLQHRHTCGTGFQWPASTLKEVIFVAERSGTITGFHAMLEDTGTNTSIAFDFKKNGSTILTGVVTITHAASDRAVSDGTLASSTFVAGDVFTAHMAVTSSTGAAFPYAWAEFDENGA